MPRKIHLQTSSSEALLAIDARSGGECSEKRIPESARASLRAGKPPVCSTFRGFAHRQLLGCVIAGQQRNLSCTAAHKNASSTTQVAPKQENARQKSAESSQSR
jgi:hypothetical protein